MPEPTKTERPQWSTVNLYLELIELADQMHERADQLLGGGDRVLLRASAVHTVQAAELLSAGRWDTEAASAWLTAGRAALERVS